MGKGENRKNAVVRDGLKRINFLYQAAMITLASNPKNTGLARFYIESMDATSHKQLLKLDPSIKRTICKCCHSLLIPGVTCKVRTRARRETHIVITCLYCNTVKRFLSRKDYVLWKGKNNAEPTLSPDSNSKSTQKQKQKVKSKTYTTAPKLDDCNQIPTDEKT